MQLLIIIVILLSRFFGSSLHPISPYWEEVALAYDAFSISQTARDHHGNFLPLTAFVSFGDYKPSLYFYVTVPFIKIFGPTLFAVRLPTLLASLALIFGVAFLAKKFALLFLRIKDESAINFIFQAGLFLGGFSPWLLYFSRSAWESTIASALLLWGVIFGLLFWEKNKFRFLSLSLSCLVLATYAYHATRLSAPLIGFFGLVAYLIHAWHTKSRLLFLRKHFFKLVVIFLMAALTWLPVGQSMLLQSGQQRIAETGIFNDLNIIEKSNELRAAHNYNLYSRIVYHRYIFFALEVTKNFFSHFSFDYLFVHGDHNPRHSIQTFGNFYALDSLLFIAGLVFLFHKQRRLGFALLLMIVIGVLPAAFTKATPHALRTLAAWPAFMIFLIFGLWQLREFSLRIWQKKWLFYLFMGVYLLLFAKFFHQLLYVYPTSYRHEWQYGYQEMIEKLARSQSHFDRLYVTREKGRPSMYYFFYQRIDPKRVQAIDAQTQKDQGELLSFENLYFIDQSSQVLTNQPGKIVVVSSFSFYQQYFATANWQIIDQTADQEWVFYVPPTQQ